MLLSASIAASWFLEPAVFSSPKPRRSLALRDLFGQRARVGAEELESRAAGGDRDALEALLRTHAAAVYQLCHYVAGPADGPDVAQQALERVVTSIHLFDPARGNFRAWALSVARNACRDRMRRRGLERQAFADDGDAVVDLASSASPTPEDVSFARADAQRLAEALQELPERSRMALVMFHLQEATYEEIATALGVPIGTVMTWLHRGRKKLRDVLESESVSERGA